MITNLWSPQIRSNLFVGHPVVLLMKRELIVISVSIPFICIHEQRISVGFAINLYLFGRMGNQFSFTSKCLWSPGNSYDGRWLIIYMYSDGFTHLTCSKAQFYFGTFWQLLDGAETTYISGGLRVCISVLHNADTCYFGVPKVSYVY